VTPPVAVAVVSTNQRDLLARALRSLEPEQQAGRVETWVVDNASEDGSAEMVHSEFPWVELLALDENVGYGRAVNLVAERSNADWIAPANEDIELRPGAVERLLAAAEQHPEAAVLAPRLVLADGSTQHSVFAFPTLALALAVNLGIARANGRVGDRLCIEGLWDPDRPREVPWAIATFFICRREAFDAVDGFDPEQFIHAEDLDLEWRLQRAGWRVRYVPDAEVFHVGSAATKHAFGEDLMPRYLAASYAWMLKRRGALVARSIALVSVIGSAIRVAVYGALAGVGLRRFRERRDAARRWARAHAVGLSSRANLMRRR
jgi:N-acetylglucosaminyl-diphospho-decaprenol L-rhamnosyltransferase